MNHNIKLMIFITSICILCSTGSVGINRSMCVAGVWVSCFTIWVIPYQITKTKSATTQISLKIGTNAGSIEKPHQTKFSLFDYSPLIGSASQKINILKIICKVLSCVGVGLIKKTLLWQQIFFIPCSGNLENCYQNPFISARWSTSFNVHHILHTGIWLKGENSGKCCSISCISFVF